MAKTSIENQVQSMNMEELDQLWALMAERVKEIKRQESIETAKQIRLGMKVVYLNKKEEVEGEVNGIMPDYISVGLAVEENGCKNRRLPYDKIIRIVEE